MSKRLQQIAKHKQLLIDRARVQRSELDYLAQQVDKPLRIIDEAFSILRLIQMRLVFSGSTRPSVLITPRHHFLWWAGRIFAGWEMYRVVRKHWPKRRS
jgi:hypothetical protein